LCLLRRCLWRCVWSRWLRLIWSFWLLIVRWLQRSAARLHTRRHRCATRLLPIGIIGLRLVRIHDNPVWLIGIEPLRRLHRLGSRLWAALIGQGRLRVILILYPLYRRHRVDPRLHWRLRSSSRLSTLVGQILLIRISVLSALTLALSRRHRPSGWSNGRRRSHNGPTRNRPYWSGGPHRRRHWRCPRLRCDQFALLIDQRRTLIRNMNRVRNWRRNDGLPCWCHVRSCQWLHVLHLASIHVNLPVVCGATGLKVFLPHGANASGLVYISNVRDIDHIHVGVLYVYPVAFANVGDVHLVDVTGAGVIPRPVSLTRPEREPRRNADTADMNPTCKDHQSRRPDRTGCGRSRNPSPASPIRDPPTIVERRIAPWLILNPDPSPWFVIHPVAIVIRSPIRGDISRKPDCPILGVWLPIPVSIQISCPRDLWAYISVRSNAAKLLIALLAPVVEIVGLCRLQPLGRDRVGAGQFN
jgi:hypothetical protein